MQLTSNNPHKAYCPPTDQDWQLIAEDPAFLVVNKPAGLLSVPGRGEEKVDCLVTRVQAHYPDALIVHRLDMDTSGLLVLARGKEMHRRLSIAFMNRQVDKQYLAVVAGEIAPAGSIDLPLAFDWPNRPKHKVDWQEGKPSLTHFRRLAYDPAEQTSRVELTPVTGRSHQLRVHLASQGHPILGDELYAGEHASRAPRLLLHAAKLAFCHPNNGQCCRFEISADF